jgi:pyrroloquinoline quinone biosynthesis protein B
VRVVVLGSAAGGGIPQWNCACPNCQAARHQGGVVKPRSQDSIAVSSDGKRWFLLNVSPDITRQIESNGVLQPAAPALGADGPAARSSPIIGAVLTNGDLDHSMGLLSLREWTPLCLYATRETYAGLVVQNAVFRTLSRQRPHVLYRQLELDVFVPLRDVEGNTSGLSLSAFPVQGKVPLHMESFLESSDETNIGVIVRDDETGARLVYVPGAGSAQGIAERARDATCLFFDGTFWSDAELAAFGQSPRLAREMAHLPVSGPGGSLELLAPLSVGRRYYTHVNNTNPMLREDSEERRAIEERGWSVAEDGLELLV